MANAGVRGRPIAPLVLSAEERAYLERQVRRHRVARSLSERCRIILRCADGLASKDVAAEFGLHEHTVGKWRRRFLKDRCEGLLDEARPGRPRTIDDDQVAAVIERTLRTTPVDATHWSIRALVRRGACQSERGALGMHRGICSIQAHRNNSVGWVRPNGLGERLAMQPDPQIHALCGRRLRSRRFKQDGRNRRELHRPGHAA